MNTYSYLIIAPIPEAFKAPIVRLSEQIRFYAPDSNPYKKLPPHLTFVHLSLPESSQEQLLQNVRSVALQATSLVATLGGIVPFGKKFIVLSVQTSMSLAKVWLQLYDCLANVPGRVLGRYDKDNTLHVTLVKDMFESFEAAYLYARMLNVESCAIPLDKLEVYRKLHGGSEWEKVETFHIGRE
jgi:2'-5' RNA ligase